MQKRSRSGILRSLFVSKECWASIVSHFQSWWAAMKFLVKVLKCPPSIKMRIAGLGQSRRFCPRISNHVARIGANGATKLSPTENRSIHKLNILKSKEQELKEKKDITHLWGKWCSNVGFT